jgi:putative transposase
LLQDDQTLGRILVEAKLKMEVLQSLLEPCDRKTYGIKLKQAAEKLGKTVRTLQRLVKKYQEQGLSAITEPERSDRGNYRIDELETQWATWGSNPEPAD